MTDTRAAARYVKSLLDLAVEKKVLEEVHRDMLYFSEVVSMSRPLALMLRNPVIKHDQKLAVLKKIFSGKVNSLTMSFLEIITRKNREPILAAIARRFHSAYNEYKGIRKATVTTAVPLDEKLRDELKELAHKYSDREHVELIEEVDAELIGGFVLKVGDRQVDASIKNKLRDLQVEFTQNPYIKEL